MKECHQYRWTEYQLMKPHHKDVITTHLERERRITFKHKWKSKGNNEDDHWTESKSTCHLPSTMPDPCQVLKCRHATFTPPKSFGDSDWCKFCLISLMLFTDDIILINVIK